jgi:hypothetical protein
MTVIIRKGSSKQAIRKKLENASGKKFPAKKFTGKIKINEDAVDIQRRLRDEWK